MSDTVTETRGALVRLATLMLKVPMAVVRQHLSEAEWKELVGAYVTASPLVESDYGKPDNPDARPVPPAIKTGFYRSVLGVIKSRRPEVVQKWDQWDYRIYAPISLDDEAKVVVRFLNSNKTEQEVVLAL